MSYHTQYFKQYLLVESRNIFLKLDWKPKLCVLLNGSLYTEFIMTRLFANNVLLLVKLQLNDFFAILFNCRWLIEIRRIHIWKILKTSVKLTRINFLHEKFHSCAPANNLHACNSFWQCCCIALQDFRGLLYTNKNYAISNSCVIANIAICHHPKFWQSDLFQNCQNRLHIYTFHFFIVVFSILKFLSK